MSNFFSRGIVVILGLVAFIVFLNMSGAMPSVVSALGGVAEATSEVVGDQNLDNPDATRAPVDVDSAITESDDKKTTKKVPASKLAISVASAKKSLAALGSTTSTPAGYEASLFGKGWIDVDRNGCPTDEDAKARDILKAKIGKDGCTVSSGILSDPYTGITAQFSSAQKPATVVVDRIVGLADAWQSGADGWDPVSRAKFANDPLNLLVVDKNTAEARAARPADQWSPPNTKYRCDYVSRQVAVKTKYDLTVTDGERTAMNAALGSCAV